MSIYTDIHITYTHMKTHTSQTLHMPVHPSSTETPTRPCSDNLYLNLYLWKPSLVHVLGIVDAWEVASATEHTL